MSGRGRGGSGRGHRMAAARGAVTMLSVGFCLLTAPAAHADLDDLLDTVIGAASAVDVADVPGDPVDLDASGVLQDPLTQLDQLFHDSPGQLGSESAPADAGAPTDVGISGDGAPTNPGDTNSTPGGAEHDGSNSGNSSNTPSLPKFSMPSSGSGSGGSGSGGSGGGPGSSAAKGAKTKANTSATKPGGLPKAEEGGTG